MSFQVRVSILPYNCMTDTDPDHYSLLADGTENVLIKQLTSGDSGTHTTPSGLHKFTINHGLGYVPMFFPFYKYSGYGCFYVNNAYNEIEFPIAIAAADTENLYYICQESDPELFYRIFYDDMSLTGSPEIAESGAVFKIARPGKGTQSKNPNDYIMHSSLNNLKIIHKGVQTVNLSSGVNTISHGANVDDIVQAVIFCQFPDGKTTVISGLDTYIYSYDESKYVCGTYFDTSNIYIDILGQSSFTVKISYYFFGKGKDNTVDNSGPLILVGDTGVNVLEATNPDQYKFRSDYQTLKYYLDDEYSMGNVSNTTVYEITHGLGYTPFFAGYVSDLQQFTEWNGNTEAVFASTPYYLGRSTFINPTQDVGAYVYADSSKIYLKAYFQTNAIGTSFPFNKFLYKIFRNNLGV